MRYALSRRQTLLAAVGAGVIASPLRPTLLSAAEKAEKAAAGDIKDEDIFRFALNLEYMEAEYYLRGIRGKGIDEADLGESPGKVVGGEKVKFETKPSRNFLRRWRRTSSLTSASIGRRSEKAPSIVPPSTS
jgi:hypothetical protein